MARGSVRGSRSGLRRVRVVVLLALVPGLLGIGLTRWPPAEGLERAGLDLLFRMRGERPAPPDVCVVAIDLDSYGALEVDPKLAWPRGLHAKLIQTLVREGAAAIVFDVLFLEAGDPEQDMQLAWAIEDAGNVVLGATIDQIDDPRFRRVQRVEPWGPFAEAADVLADVNLPPDPDDVIRSVWLEPDGRPGLALAAYEVATGDRSLRGDGPQVARLIDYYGPARTIKTVSFYQALDPAKYLPDGFFRGKIVFVGLSEAAATGLAAKDAFPTPYRDERGRTTYGVEIHATVAANLVEGRAIDLLPPGIEALLLMLLPVLALLVFVRLGPLYGAAALVGLALLPWGTAYIAFAEGGLWTPVVIASAIQLPLAYTVSVVWYYLTTVRERERVKRAFSYYLSPESARQISEDPAALNLGGEVIVATAMFTDIEGFSSVAESMTAEQTASMLNRYFSEVTGHVFETGGTLVKYIGDAVFAIWGAPARVDDHAVRACRTAISLARMEVSRSADSNDPAKRLRTRIGVHTGSMLVGNLGSLQRFDYTAIGDAVNLAARIEGINKMFGTRAIASAETLEAAGRSIVTRRLGRVRVVGREASVELFELLGERGGERIEGAETIEPFERALACFERGELEQAIAGFAEVLDRTDGEDGPSSYYLRVCKELVRDGVGSSWSGVIAATSK